MNVRLRSKPARPQKTARRSREPEIRLDATLSFMRALWALDHGLRQRSRRMHIDLGLTGPQRLVVRIIGQFPGSSAGSVAVILNLHPSTLTEILKDLEKRGFIKRRADSRDRRRAVLDLTPAGRRVDRLHAGTVEASVRKALRTLPKHKIRTTEEVLGILALQLSREK